MVSQATNPTNHTNGLVSVHAHDDDDGLRDPPTALEANPTHKPAGTTKDLSATKDLPASRSRMNLNILRSQRSATTMAAFVPLLIFVGTYVS